MRKRLNVRLLVKLGIALVVLGGGVHALHAVQVNRLANDLFERGEQATLEFDKDAALTNFGRYLMLRPDDISAQARYGIELAHAAATPAAQWRAYSYLEKVITRLPDHADVRQVLGLLAVRLERYGDAARFLLPLRGTAVDQSDLEQTLAWCFRGAGENEKAAECLRNGIRARPDRIENYVLLADLRLRLNDADAAREVMDEAVAANAKSAEALMSRARFRRQQREFDTADSDFEQASSLAPNDIAIIAERAEFARSRDQIDRARKLLHTAIAQQGRDPRLVLGLARLEHDVGHGVVARRLVEEPCKEFANGEAERLALLVDWLVEEGRLEEAERLSPTGPWAGYARARLAMHRGQWIEAARQLEAARSKLVRSTDWLTIVDLALAECYRAMGDNLRRAQAIRRARENDPASRLARQSLARALFDAGRFADSRLEWELLMRLPDAPSAGHDALARATVSIARQNPKDRPTWAAVDQVLTAAEKQGADPLAAALLRADALRLWDQPALADELLQKTGLRFPAHPEPLLAQADVALEREDVAAGLAYIEAADEAGGRRSDGKVILRRVHANRVAGREVAVLSEQSIAALSPTDQQSIWRELARSALMRGDWREAQRLASSWAAAVPFDLAARQFLFELAQQYESDTQVRAAIANLRRIEGDDGVHWRCAEASRMLGLIRRETGPAQKKLLWEAREILTDAARLQPEWSRPYLLAALLDEAEGSFDTALTHYQAAFDRGEYAEAGVERLARLLVERGKNDEADRILSRYDAAVSGALPASLARLASQVALELKDAPRAARLARRAVSDDTRDYRDLVWLAGILERAGDHAGAEATLNAATARFGHIADVWEAQLRFLIHTSQWNRVEPALSEAQQSLTAAKQPLDGLARCYEAGGRMDLAEKTYRQALSALPRNPFLNRRVAQFYLFADRPMDALPFLHNVIVSPVASPEHVAWARRQVATSSFQQLALVRNGSPPIAEADALKMLDENGKTNPADERARALVLAVNPARREEARKLFLQSQTAGPLTADEQFRLSQLQDLLGDSAEGDRLIEELLERYPENAQYLAGQIRRLSNRGENDAARMLVDRLQKLEPDSPRVRQLRTD